MNRFIVVKGIGTTFDVRDRHTNAVVEAGFYHRMLAADSAKLLNTSDKDDECVRNLRPGQPCACPDCN